MKVGFTHPYTVRYRTLGALSSLGCHLQKKWVHPLPSVLLVDNSQIILKTLGNILRQHSDISVIGAVSTLAEAIQLNEELRPDVTVMDLGMTSATDSSALEAKQLVQQSKTMVCISLLQAEDIGKRLEAIGVSGCIDKTELFVELPKRIRELYPSAN